VHGGFLVEGIPIVDCRSVHVVVVATGCGSQQ
jgi:hypothetical protein